jgi:hypothetical protein
MVRRSKKKICVSTEELSAALLLLKKGGTDHVQVAYQPYGYLVLANAYTFVAFTGWTKALGPLPTGKK